MNKKFSVKGMLQNGGLFLLLMGLMLYLLLRDNNIGDIINTISKVNPYYIAIAVGCMCLFVCCEAMNIGRSLKMFGYPVRFLQCIKYALVGFFFSSVTPSASGGQPMQIYYMHKDRIDFSHSTLALLIELASYQFVTVTMAVLGFIFQFRLLNHSIGKIKYLLMLGIALNTIVLGVILMAIFSKKILQKVVNGICTLMERFHYKKIEAFHKKAFEEIEKYQVGARYIKENKGVLVKIVLTTFLQITALHSIPLWVYRAFGLSAYSFISVIALQAVLYISVSALPLPGAVGVSESGFMILFKTLFPVKIISSAMLLSRGVSFYLFVVISGLFIMLDQLLRKRIRVQNIKHQA